MIEKKPKGKLLIWQEIFWHLITSAAKHYENISLIHNFLSQMLQIY